MRRKSQKDTKGVMSRSKLIDVLKKIKPGLANNEIIEQSTHFIFEEDFIRTYNDHVAISHQMKTGLKGAVKAVEFYNLLSKMTDDELSIEQTQDAFVVTGKRIKASVKIDSDIKIQTIQVPGLNAKAWKPLPEDFSNAIKLGLFSVSKNMNVPEFNCLWITGKHMFSCDGYRGTKQTMANTFDGDFLLPSIAAKDLKEYSVQKMLESKGWLHFANKEKTIFSCRTYAERAYPSTIWNFFKIKGTKINLPEDFHDVIERIQTLVTADFDLDRLVEILIEDNTLLCSGKGPHGSVTEKVKIDYDGKAIEVKVHPGFMIEILSQLNNMVVGERLLFQGKNFDHAICLSS